MYEQQFFFYITSITSMYYSSSICFVYSVIFVGLWQE